MANLRRWSVVLLILALFLLYNQQIPLTQDERSHLTAPYQATHHVYQIQAHYHSHDQIRVSMLATSISSGEAERINVIYDRTRQTIVAAETTGFGMPLDQWTVQFAIIFAFCAGWLVYLDPLIAGRYCPYCRVVGIFPRILREKERTIFPSVLADDGDYTPEIIETERACPSCSFREYGVREHSISVQGNLLAELKGSVDVFRSNEQNAQDIREIEQRAKTKGITRQQHLERLEQAKAKAAAKTTPRP